MFNFQLTEDKKMADAKKYAIVAVVALVAVAIANRIDMTRKLING